MEPQNLAHASSTTGDRTNLRHCSGRAAPGGSPNAVAAAAGVVGGSSLSSRRHRCASRAASRMRCAASTCAIIQRSVTTASSARGRLAARLALVSVV